MPDSPSGWFASGRVFQGDPSSLREAISAGRLTYHAGSIRGALPTLA
jgi:hypothetical protein